MNKLLAEAHEDFATLRRELYDSYLLDRRDGIYWRQEIDGWHDSSSKE